MNKTKIEWTKNADGSAGSTWGVIMGCSRISPGCGGGSSFSGTNGEQGGCYAEGIAARFSGLDKHGKPGAFAGFAEMTEKGPRWTRRVVLVLEKLDQPLRVKKSTTWFISMSDLFHEALTNEEIALVFAVMALAHWHTFQVLTKRSKRMAEWFIWAAGGRHVWAACQGMTMPRGKDKPAPGWPLPNVWLGVSVEAAAYKGRLDELRASPAAVRFCSLEPLLDDLATLDFSGIDQAIVGAESGRGARPMHDGWVRSIRDQAQAQGTAFFYKQKLGPNGRKVSLPLLDGQRWTEMPAAREVAQ